MADWTVITTTLGASGITGVVGYLGARLQSKTAIGQARAETDRLREQHAEEHLRNRQTNYHLLLDVLRRIEIATWSGPGLTEAGFSAFMEEVGHLLNGVLLFGTQEVRTAVTVVNTALGQIEFHVGIGSAPFDDALREGLDAKGEDLWRGRDELVTAMRNDVAP